MRGTNRLTSNQQVAGSSPAGRAPPEWYERTIAIPQILPHDEGLVASADTEEGVWVGRDLEAWIEEFLLACRVEEKSPKTIKWYGDMLGWFVDWLESMGAQLVLDEITPSVIRRYLHWLRSRPPKTHRRTATLSDRTIKGHYASLKAFYSFLVWEGAVSPEQNPMAKVRAPRLSQKTVVALRPEEIRALLSATIRGGQPVNIRNHLMMMLILDTGIRAGELVGLRVCDLDLGGDYGLAKVIGKGNKERFVPIGPSVVDRLKKWLSHSRIKLASKDCPFVFCTIEGNPLTTDRLYQIVRYWAKRAGIESRCSPHILRHTFAISFLRANPDQFALQKILGHSTLEMTRRYCNLLLDDVIEAHRRARLADSRRASK